MINHKKETKIKLIYVKFNVFHQLNGTQSSCGSLANENNTLNEDYKKCYDNIMDIIIIDFKIGVNIVKSCKLHFEEIIL